MLILTHYTMVVWWYVMVILLQLFILHYVGNECASPFDQTNTIFNMPPHFASMTVQQHFKIHRVKCGVEEMLSTSIHIFICIIKLIIMPVTIRTSIISSANDVQSL